MTRRRGRCQATRSVGGGGRRARAVAPASRRLDVVLAGMNARGPPLPQRPRRGRSSLGPEAARARPARRRSSSGSAPRGAQGRSSRRRRSSAGGEARRLEAEHGLASLRSARPPLGCEPGWLRWRSGSSGGAPTASASRRRGPGPESPVSGAPASLPPPWGRSSVRVPSAARLSTASGGSSRSDLFVLALGRRGTAGPVGGADRGRSRGRSRCCERSRRSSSPPVVGRVARKPGAAALRRARPWPRAARGAWRSCRRTTPTGCSSCRVRRGGSLVDAGGDPPEPRRRDPRTRAGALGRAAAGASATRSSTRSPSTCASRIERVAGLVGDMNATLARLRDRLGRTVQLEWAPREDDELRTVARLLRRSVATLGEAEREPLIAFFRDRIQQARELGRPTRPAAPPRICAPRSTIAPGSTSRSTSCRAASA